MKKFNLRCIPAFCLLLLVLGNCSILKPRFDPVGHQNAVTLQKEALALMEKASGSFVPHAEAVYSLMTRVERAYEHARPRYKNSRVTGTWDALRNPLGNRLGRFMLEWEKEDVLDETYIKDSKKSVEEDFNLLVELEEGKKK